MGPSSLDTEPPPLIQINHVRVMDPAKEFGCKVPKL